MSRTTLIITVVACLTWGPFALVDKTQAMPNKSVASAVSSEPKAVTSVQEIRQKWTFPSTL